MWRQFVLFGGVWIAIVIVSFGWQYHVSTQNEAKNFLNISRTFFNQIVITREWNARHGGVYVYADAQTPPNPYLKEPERDIVLNNGRVLTRVNPAYMTRQIAELTVNSDQAKIHITSLQPTRPENAPAPWERKALKQFEQGASEYGAFACEEYRYMAPLKTVKSCLKCHADQGYRIGEVRGGISVVLPRTTAVPLKPMIIGHLSVALAGLLFLLFSARKLETLYNQLQQQSIRDPLTDIPNRRYFNQHAEEELLRTRRDRTPLSVLMIDVDFFKDYNDCYGHLEGDACLKRIVGTLKQSLHRPPDWIARYGGEEFVVILPNTPADGAFNVAEALRGGIEALQIPHEASRCSEVVTVSIGVATIMPEFETISYEALINQADQALYRAKEQGRNRVVAAGE